MQMQVVQIVGGSADCHTMFARREIRYNATEAKLTKKVSSVNTYDAPCVHGRHIPASLFA